MPYEWTCAAPESSGAVSYRLRLWPYQSLPRRGFVWFIGLTSSMMSLPILALLGTPALWGLLPFMLLAIAAIWWAIMRSYRRGRISEELFIDRAVAKVVRHDPGGHVRDWTTSSYWLRPVLRKGPVESYLTLTDGRREIELGAFLTPDERCTLYDELIRNLARLR